jgi:NADH:ubiquinone oxidoreductase subunit 4 (subunit M)
MVNHGISTGALFLLVGVIYERRHTHELNAFGGLAKVMPNYATFFVVIALSSMGLPGTNGFVGEFMILAGTFLSDYFGPVGPLYTLFAATGVILAAIYLLHAILKVFFGPVTRDENRNLSDLTYREIAVLSPMVLFIFWIGLFPASFLKPMEPSVKAFAQNYSAKLEAGDQRPSDRHIFHEPVNKLRSSKESKLTENPWMKPERGYREENPEARADFVRVARSATEGAAR